MASCTNSRRRNKGLWVASASWLAAISVLFYAFQQCREPVSFDAPVAYAMLGDHLFVVEHGDVVLDLRYDYNANSLKLVGSYNVEQDDEQYYYMVRGLVSCEHGVMVRSYIYDREDRRFMGHRYRKYDHERKAHDVFTIFFENPDDFPELFYAHGMDEEHFFVNGIKGQRCVWQIAEGEHVMMRDGIVPDSITERGGTNQEQNAWNAIGQTPDGEIYLSSVEKGLIVSCPEPGEAERVIGEAGFGEGQLLAAQELMNLSWGKDTNEYLTVASQGNRSWVQYDVSGQVVRTISPLKMGYPYPDMLVEQVIPGPDHSWLTFDLANKCFVRLRAGSCEVVTDYAAGWRTMSIWLLVLAGALVGVGIVGFAFYRCRWRLRFPFFMKLLVVLIPLTTINALIVGWRVEDAFLNDVEHEYLLRSENLAQAVLNNVPIDMLAQIQKPGDRDGEIYDTIYKTVSSILDREQVSSTPKWIIHKIRDGRYYFGINIWRGPIYEPYIIPQSRRMFYEVLESGESQHGRFTDEQGEWFSYLSPVKNDKGEVIYVLELYRVAEEMDRAAAEAKERLFRIVIYSILITALLVFLLSKILVKPLQRLAQAVHLVSEGDFDHRVDVRSNDEIGTLSHDFNQMIDELKQHMADLQQTTAEKERIESDIRLARDVQQGIIPKVFPPFPKTPSIEIFARIDPAREVGGDFYDFFDVDDDHYGVVVADVSGKGVPAGLFMMVARTVLRGNARKRLDAAETLSWVNRLLAADNPSMMFVTMFYMVCNKQTGRITYCNAGHNSPFVIRKRGERYRVDQLPETRNMIIGVEEHAVFEDCEIQLDPGESIVIYTDGVTEPVDREDNMFGEDRLGEELERLAGLPNEKSCNSIFEKVSVHQQGLEQFDDFTLLYFKYLGE